MSNDFENFASQKPDSRDRTIIIARRNRHNPGDPVMYQFRTHDTRINEIRTNLLRAIENYTRDNPDDRGMTWGDLPRFPLAQLFKIFKPYDIELRAFCVADVFVDISQVLYAAPENTFFIERPDAVKPGLHVMFGAFQPVHGFAGAAAHFTNPGEMTVGQLMESVQAGMHLWNLTARDLHNFDKAAIQPQNVHCTFGQRACLCLNADTPILS